MSIQSWKNEFYPYDAIEALAGEAAEHSLRKWTGLLPENLQKHGLVLKHGRPDPSLDLLDTETLERLETVNSSSSCALCVQYEVPTKAGQQACERCPLHTVRGTRCYWVRVAEDHIEVRSPYHLLHEQRNPKPMIAWLEKAKELEESDAAANASNNLTLESDSRSSLVDVLGVDVERA